MPFLTLNCLELCIKFTFDILLYIPLWLILVTPFSYIMFHVEIHRGAELPLIYNAWEKSVCRALGGFSVCVEALAYNSFIIWLCFFCLTHWVFRQKCNFHVGAGDVFDSTLGVCLLTVPELFSSALQTFLTPAKHRQLHRDIWMNISSQVGTEENMKGRSTLKEAEKQGVWNRWRQSSVQIKEGKDWNPHCEEESDSVL